MNDVTARPNSLPWPPIIYFAAIAVTVRPDRGTDHLVTDGPFSFTRNPLYVAGTMLVLGIGLVSGIVWFLLLAILAAFTVQKLAIEREERHLQARFGETYLDYARGVRRWI
jgi:protein-S-isoprenylcysteine O-methyltransferase Ste14